MPSLQDNRLSTSLLRPNPYSLKDQWTFAVDSFVREAMETTRTIRTWPMNYTGIKYFSWKNFYCRTLIWVKRTNVKCWCDPNQAVFESCQAQSDSLKLKKFIKFTSRNSIQEILLKKFNVRLCLPRVFNRDM